MVAQLVRRPHSAPKPGELSIDPVLVNGLLDRRQVNVLFQPLVDLATRQVVGFEALARGPRGSTLENPMALFEAAEAVGRGAELDWICRSGACRAAVSARLHPAISWFINVEPSALSSACPDDLVQPVIAAQDHLRIVVEFAERQISADPATLLVATQRARSRGWGIALDDVGALPESLAMLPFIRPDVVKLDMALLHGADPLHAAAVSNAVRAYAEATDAVILAEGIETTAHEQAARVLGATYGQGWLYGRPGPLPHNLPSPQAPFPIRPSVDSETAAPFEMAEKHLKVGRAPKRLLLPMSRHLEYQALRGGESYVLLGTFQHQRHYNASTRRLYQQLAASNAFTAALGAALDVPSPGVATVNLPLSDPLVNEWDVIVVGAHFAGALLSRDAGEDVSDMDRSFDYAVTHDRNLVLRAARSVLARITAETPPCDRQV